MKIDANKPTEIQDQRRGAQNVQKSTGVEPKGKAADARKTSTGDTVDISHKSKEIADIMSAVNQLPDVRNSKVQEIKQRVETGTYTIDPRNVAEKILKEI